MKLNIRSGNARFMKPVNNTVSACRHCRLYRAEGRRGGHCQQLGVPVQGGWKACSLAETPFATSWKQLTGITSWPMVSDLQEQTTQDLSLPTIALPEGEAIPVAAVFAEEMLMGME
jgi:hypothetical protein